MSNTNKENISNFSSASGTTGRIIAARIFPNLDVLSTLEEICLKHNIKNGQITTTIGSLRKVTLHYVSTTAPAPGEKYTTILEMEGPFSVLSGQGLVSPGDEPGTMNIHYHAVVSGENDVIYGGHIEPGTITLTTMDVFIQEIHGIEISRARENISGVNVLVTTFTEV